MEKAGAITMTIQRFIFFSTIKNIFSPGIPDTSRKNKYRESNPRKELIELIKNDKIKI